MTVMAAMKVMALPLELLSAANKTFLALLPDLAVLPVRSAAARLVASHVETRGFMRHEELLVALHQVIPTQAGIQACPQRIAV